MSAKSYHASRYIACGCSPPLWRRGFSASGVTSLAVLRTGSRISFRAQICQELSHWPRAQVALAVVAHRDALRLGLLAADHGHVGNLLHLGVANLGLQFLVAVVEIHTNASR